MNTDPFNWPYPNRSDLMSQKGLTPAGDGVQTRTKHFRDKSRTTSDNLNTQDIHGKNYFH